MDILAYEEKKVCQAYQERQDDKVSCYLIHTCYCFDSVILGLSGLPGGKGNAGLPGRPGIKGVPGESGM
jgi:hypothetical protein